MWKIYKDRNGWIHGEAIGSARSKESAKVAANALGGRFIASEESTWFRTTLADSWRRY